MIIIYALGTMSAKQQQKTNDSQGYLEKIILFIII